MRKVEAKKAKQAGQKPVSGTFPVALYDRLRTTAKRENRSIIGQLRHIVEQYYEHEDAARNIA